METDDIVPGILDRMARLADSRRNDFETLQLTEYLAGGFYTDHVDEEACTEQIDGRDVGPRTANFDDNARRCGDASRRAHTLLIYLTDAKDGATYFPHLGRRILPKRGRAVLFHPTTPSGQSDPLLVHGSEESRNGGKVVIQQWIGHPGYG